MTGSMTNPKKILAANWKLNKSPREAQNFVTDFSKAEKLGLDFVFFPSALCAEVFSRSKLEWGLQNTYFENSGAFTGENSAGVAYEMGSRWVLVGHSERRTLFHESDAEIEKKLQRAWNLNMQPILCVGETLSERENGQTLQVLKSQLMAALGNAPESVKVQPLLTVAYEPVWAIGTGKVATTAQVQECHLEIFKILKNLGFSEKTSILYGGSVKPENAGELSKLPHVSGFLVGGASLKVDSLMSIAKNMQN